MYTMTMTMTTYDDDSKLAYGEMLTRTGQLFYEHFTDVLDMKQDKVEILSKRVFTVLDGWIRESLSELINNVLSLPDGSEKDHAKRILKQRMENLYDKNLKQNLYSVCRSLKILI